MSRHITQLDDALSAGELATLVGLPIHNNGDIAHLCLTSDEWAALTERRRLRVSFRLQKRAAMRNSIRKLVLDLVGRGWDRGVLSPMSSVIPGIIRTGAATALALAGLVAFCAGLLGEKEHSDDITDARLDVVAPQGTEPQEWGGGVHDAHGASAGQ
ncbi:hypothetical protein, partial [Xanthomonas vasicola]